MHAARVDRDVFLLDFLFELVNAIINLVFVVNSYIGWYINNVLLYQVIHKGITAEFKIFALFQ